MDPRLQNIPYRVAQHWTFDHKVNGLADYLIILGLEESPTQGVIYQAYITFDPPFAISDNTFNSGGEYWLTREALDKSVVKLVDKCGPLPDWFGTTGEFRMTEEDWSGPWAPVAENKTVGQFASEFESQLQQQRKEEAAREPYVPPKSEELGLWSVISHDDSNEFRNRIQKDPSIAYSQLPHDFEDGYCFANEQPFSDCTPLMFACESGSLDVGKIILERNVDVNQQNQFGDTALHFATRSSNHSPDLEELVKLVCEKGADPNHKNQTGLAPLQVGYCSDKVAKHLVDAGAKLSLNYAIRLGDLDWARNELKTNPNAVKETPHPFDLIENLGWLIRTIAEDRSEENQGYSLTESDSEVLARWRSIAKTQDEVFREHQDVLELLLKAGADPDQGSSLFYAIQWYGTEYAHWLLKNGADPNHDLKSGTANYLPDTASTRKMKNLLLEFGAEENPYQKSRDDDSCEWDKKRDRLTELFN